MKSLVVTPGDVVVTDFGIYQHWSLVTDNLCDKGKPMLLSATKRNSTVQEEPWDVVTKGKKTYIANAQRKKDAAEMLQAARSQIGRWKYSVDSANCEHFIKWASGLEVTSTQVTNTAIGAATGALAVGLVAENPKFIHFLGGALLVGGVALALTRAAQKSSETESKNTENV
ncbi:lecithin retinol acyltransferase family protein [Endozoicomonas sp. ALB032]|uniref:lecithin retinol acyltransferase family protein n=1 Tax=Endozoicomonas sp. ALB032 TaxID=3403082 RepID=UPI003BB7E52B